MDALYACLFSNGFVKVGRSAEPSKRIKQHADRVDCLGVHLTEASVYECKGASEPAEDSLIARCVKYASKRHKHEWFDGLVFPDVCRWAAEFAAYVKPEPQRFAVDHALPDFRVILAQLKQRGRTQAEVALYCGCAQSSISDIATGVTKDPCFSVGAALISLVEAVEPVPA